MQNNNYKKYLSLIFFTGAVILSLELIASKTLVLTTEKDASRLKSLAHKKLYFLPITLEVDDYEKFETALRNFIKKLD